MNDINKIIFGLIIFILIITFPFWIKLGKSSLTPELELTEQAKIAKKCVMPNDKMVFEHMKLLDLWRHSVVRNAERIFINHEGLEYNMSISNTCLSCHSNKINFCDKCHNYLSVEPYCWDCHIDNPEEGDVKK